MKPIFYYLWAAEFTQFFTSLSTHKYIYVIIFMRKLIRQLVFSRSIWCWRRKSLWIWKFRKFKRNFRFESLCHAVVVGPNDEWIYENILFFFNKLNCEKCVFSGQCAVPYLAKAASYKNYSLYREDCTPLIGDAQQFFSNSPLCFSSH